MAKPLECCDLAQLWYWLSPLLLAAGTEKLERRRLVAALHKSFCQAIDYLQLYFAQASTISEAALSRATTQAPPVIDGRVAAGRLSGAAPSL